jgi:uncharacterized cofD-like protein
MRKKRKKIVTIGGGTGPSALQKGLVLIGGKKRFETTAVVAMADRGGSSGRLRDEQGFLPPGDLLKALLALSPEPYAWPLLTKRFANAVPEMAGHSVGNILVSYLAEHLGGDLLKSILALQEILNCQGRVLPAYLEHVDLVAETNLREIRGEGKIEEWFYDFPPDSEKLVGVHLEPVPELLPQAAMAIKGADLVVIGPGSFYTSLVAVLRVNGMKDALAKTRIVYVVNVITHAKENPDWPVSKFVHEIEQEIGRGVDYVVANNALSKRLEDKYRKEGSRPVVIDVERHWDGRRIIRANFVSEHAKFARHDPVRLAHILSHLE